MGYDVTNVQNGNICNQSTKNDSLESILKSFLFHGPLPFAEPPLLHVSPQNPLDNVSAFIMPSNMQFGDLDLHGHFAIFSLV